MTEKTFTRGGGDNGFDAIRNKWGPEVLDRIQFYPDAVYREAHSQNTRAGMTPDDAEEQARKDEREAQQWLARVRRDPAFALDAAKAITEREARADITTARQMDTRRRLQGTDDYGASEAKYELQRQEVTRTLEPRVV